jgi:uncharacterized RDD family membrane protein YckC
MTETVTTYSKVSIINRLVAKGIDIIIILVFALILNPVGPIIAIFYSVCADGFEGKSIGKRLVGLQTLHSIKKTPSGFKESIIRNIPIGIFIFFASIPIFWIILIIVGIPLLLLEVYLFCTLESGHRIGDILADTMVVQLASDEKKTFTPDSSITETKPKPKKATAKK